MKDNSRTIVGGICALLVGISYLLTGASYLLLPPAQLPGSIPAQFLSTVAQNDDILMLHYSAFVLSGIFAIGALPAITALTRSANAGLMDWLSKLAFLGFAVTAVSYLRQIEYVPILADRFAAGDDLMKAITAGNVMVLGGLDAQGWLRFGATGTWLLMVCVYGLREGTLTKGPVIVGVLAATMYWCIIIAFLFQFDFLFPVAAALGGIVLGPIWYIWIGIRLLRGRALNPAPAVAAPARMSHV